MKARLLIDEGFIYEEETHLTVVKTSLFSANDGFTAYDCKGRSVFRVDSYGPDANDQGEVVLMDAAGRCLLTARRKRPSLHQRWEGFSGEGMNDLEPIFSVRRSSMIGRCSVTVEVFENPGEEYEIEGDFAQRSCTIQDAANKELVAEIRPKVDASTQVLLGKDVFCLSVKPGFDGAFAMGLLLILDQINGDDDDGYDIHAKDNAAQVEPVAED